MGRISGHASHVSEFGFELGIEVRQQTPEVIQVLYPAISISLVSQSSKHLHHDSDRGECTEHEENETHGNDHVPVQSVKDLGADGIQATLEDGRPDYIAKDVQKIRRKLKKNNGRSMQTIGRQRKQKKTNYRRTMQTIDLQRKQKKKNCRMSSGSFMPTTKAFMIFFVTFALLNGTAADIIVSPYNQAVPANTTAIMRCKNDRPDKRMFWVGVDHTSKSVSIYDGEWVNPAYEEFCSVNPSDGRYDLLVKATPQMALKFVCIENGAVHANIERTAELIVVESDPTCAVERGNAISTESVDLVCTMELFGNWIPTMNWRVNGMQVPLTVTNHVERLDGQRVRVKSVLSNVSSIDRHKYVCDTYFSLASYVGNATARNVPAYVYTSEVSPDADLEGTTLSPTLPSATNSSSEPDGCRSAFISVAVILIIENVAIAVIVFIICKKYGNKFPCLKAKEKRADLENGEKRGTVPSNDNETLEMQQMLSPPEPSQNTDARD